jgi:hypothetical protein
MKNLIASALMFLSLSAVAEPSKAYQAALTDKAVLKLIETQEEAGLEFSGIVGSGNTYRCPCYSLKLQFSVKGEGNTYELKKEAVVTVKGFQLDDVSVGGVEDAE